MTIAVSIPRAVTPVDNLGGIGRSNHESRCGIFFDMFGRSFGPVRVAESYGRKDCNHPRRARISVVEALDSRLAQRRLMPSVHGRHTNTPTGDHPRRLS